MKTEYKILITRSREQSEKELRELQSEKISFFFFPTIETKRLKLSEKDLSVIKNYSLFDFLIFTSANAVKFFFEIIEPRNFIAPNSLHIAATGEKTAKALETLKIKADIVPQVFSAEGLLEMFEKDLSGKRFLIPGSKISRKVLREELSARGADVAFVPLYDTVTKSAHFEDINKLKMRKPDAFVFTSPSSVKGFLDLLEIENAADYFSDTIVIPIGDVTARSLENKGVNPSAIPERFTVRDAAVLAISILRKEN